MKVAPASTEWPICSGERTVPEPTTAPETFAISSITCSACGVRSVTSSTRNPPATSASASGRALLTSSRMITGMTGARLRVARSAAASCGMEGSSGVSL